MFGPTTCLFKSIASVQYHVRHDPREQSTQVGRSSRLNEQIKIFGITLGTNCQLGNMQAQTHGHVGVQTDAWCNKTSLVEWWCCHLPLWVASPRCKEEKICKKRHAMTMSHLSKLDDTTMSDVTSMYSSLRKNFVAAPAIVLRDVELPRSGAAPAVGLGPKVKHFESRPFHKRSFHGSAGFLGRRPVFRPVHPNWPERGTDGHAMMKSDTFHSFRNLSHAVRGCHNSVLSLRVE